LQGTLKHPSITHLAQPPNPNCLTSCVPVFAGWITASAARIPASIGCGGLSCFMPSAIRAIWELLGHTHVLKRRPGVVSPLDW